MLRCQKDFSIRNKCAATIKRLSHYIKKTFGHFQHNCYELNNLGIRYDNILIFSNCQSIKIIVVLAHLASMKIEKKLNKVTQTLAISTRAYLLENPC